MDCDFSDFKKSNENDSDTDYKNCNQTSTRPLQHSYQKSTVACYPDFGVKIRR